MICSICQCDIHIPVSIICFPCYQPNKFHCNAITRFCYECIIRYVQLNRSVLDRDSSLKCLFCNESCNPRELDYRNTFQFDFLLHSQLCPDKTSCPYCFCEVSNIFKHLEECNSSYTQCSCGYVTLKQLYKFHYIDCPDYHYCERCDQFIKKSDWYSHLETEHEMYECFDCNEIVLISNKNIHNMYLCPYRFIRCRFCKKNICFQNLEEHFNEHKNEIKKTISDIKDMLIKLYEHYNSILREEQNYFRRYFLTE